MKCAVDSCSRDAVAKSLCLMHYKRMRNNGSTERRAQERRPLIERFNDKYAINQETGCWEWTGAIARGYGVINRGGDEGPIRAHRASYELFVGTIPEGDGYHGTCVLHRCDNPRCVNPDHLFLGTNADNVADMDAKGRRVSSDARGPRRDKSNFVRGDKHPMAKLSEEAVLEIKRQLSGGVSVSEISKAFRVCKSTISGIKTGKKWAHIEEKK